MRLLPVSALWGTRALLGVHLMAFWHILYNIRAQSKPVLDGLQAGSCPVYTTKGV